MKLKECIRVSTLLAVCLIISAAPVHAEWQTFSRSDGLISHWVNAIAQDRNGDLWFATDDVGVSRYDGVNWRSYGSAELGDRRVLDVLEDRNGNIWFGTGGGAVLFDGRSWRRFTVEDGLANKFVWELLEASNGDIWAACHYREEGGVSRFDGETWHTYTTDDGLAAPEVSHIAEDCDGNIWFSTDNGASRFDGTDWRTFTVADGLPDDKVGPILCDRNGDLWFGSAHGVSRFDGSVWTHFTGENGLPGGVGYIVEDRSGDLWFGGSWHLTRFDGNEWTFFTEPDGLPGRLWGPLLEDDSGNLWFRSVAGVHRFDKSYWSYFDDVSAQVALVDRTGGLWFGGHYVHHYDSGAWTVFEEGDGLTLWDVEAILEDSSGDLWFGSTYGVSRYDGSTWTSWGHRLPWPFSEIYELAEDNVGQIWAAGTFYSEDPGNGFVGYRGVGRFDGSDWTTYTVADSIWTGAVMDMIADSDGNVWIGTYKGGVSRFDGESWRVFTEADGLVSNVVRVIFEDSAGHMWCGTDSGVSRFDGVDWESFTAIRHVQTLFEDEQGSIWAGSYGGVARYNDSGWTLFLIADGIADGLIEEIFEDSGGNIWMASWGGVSRFDGERWIPFTEADGLIRANVRTVLEDGGGHLWFGTSGRTMRYMPDFVPPRGMYTHTPDRLQAANKVDFEFAAAYGEARFIEFSYSWDDGEWSPWSTDRTFQISSVQDGAHTLQVIARDMFNNVDSTPEVWSFEIDATPPEAVVSSPAFGQAVSDSVAVEGSADDLRFKSYRVEVGRSDSEPWSLLAESDVPVNDGVLAGWNTAVLDDGEHELRLSVSDTLGLTGRYVVSVVVDNEPPWAYETSPALIKAVSGGDVYTTNREAHLYFPPNGFLQDAEVSIEELSRSEVPDTLGGGAVRVLSGYEVTWADSLLAKPATLELSYEGMEFDRDAGPGAYPDDTTFAIYRLDSESKWLRIGGTVDGDAMTISSSVAEPGWYSVFAGGQAGGAATALSALSITPRVFSPTGGFSSPQAAIGFTLGRPGPVIVKIYNRAGRLVSEVASGKQLNAGANLVHWDGRRRDGNLVEDGIYLVTVEALGHKQVKPLAVVR